MQKEESEKPKKPSKTQMADILFKQPETDEVFDVAELFTQTLLAQGLHRLLPPSFMNIQPREIYEQVKEIAKVRFGHELPSEQKKLGCLQTANTKTALLRDLCMSLGV